MPRRDFTQYVPDEVVDQLKSWLVESNFTDYVSHARRLSEMGYPASKSAIHRFGEALKEELKTDVELRMRCIESASKIATADNVIAKAKELLAWVKSGKGVGTDCLL